MVSNTLCHAAHISAPKMCTTGQRVTSRARLSNPAWRLQAASQKVKDIIFWPKAVLNGRLPMRCHFVRCHFCIRPLPPYPEAPAQQNGGPVTVNVFSVFSFYHHIQEWRVMLLCLKWHLMGKEPLGSET